MNKIALLIIVYGKQLVQSDTVKSVLDFEHTLDYLVIINNGPQVIFENDEVVDKLKLKHTNVILKNYLENKPLSWIYNDFIKNVEGVDYYVLFDDDTEVNKVYENYIFNVKDIDLELPKIISVVDKKQYYPILNQEVYTKNGFLNNREGDVFSIGSGLVISKNLKQKFLTKNIEIFDPRFALYGVDFSFFRKINLYFKQDQLNISSKVGLDHSLSRTEGKISEWRARERLYDEVLTIKYYKKLDLLRFFKFLLRKILNQQLNDIIPAVKVYVSGKHPRC